MKHCGWETKIICHTEQLSWRAKQLEFNVSRTGSTYSIFLFDNEQKQKFESVSYHCHISPLFHNSNEESWRFSQPNYTEVV